MIANLLPSPVTGRTAAADNPYIGPRPFETSEKDRFFGRDDEANELIPLVIAERLVLFYAVSGAGKSSLINARLIPGLMERNFKVLTGRVGGRPVEQGAVRNIYIHNLLLSLENSPGHPPRPDVTGLASITLKEYLADLDVEIAPQAPQPAAAKDGRLLVDAPQIIGGIQPLALIIDQFEEIFTTHPEAWQKRAEFFDQLRQAQEADPYLWVVLSIREDYIAQLEPYEHLLYGGGCARFYMQRMEYDAALEAVKNPALKIHPFEANVAEELVTSLRRIPRTERPEPWIKAPEEPEIEQIQPRDLEGQYIEPVQLQVVCFQLWEQLKKEGKAGGSPITGEDLNCLAKGGDLAEFISGALAGFYEQAITNVVRDIQGCPDCENVTERKIRDWFSRRLITEARTCDLVFKGKKETGGMPNRVVERLEQQFIIRVENRGGGIWYELSHDRFVGPILQANRAWYERNPQPILADAEAWASATGGSEKRKLLYEGRQLKAAQALLDDPQAGLSVTERKFIRASQTAASRRTVFIFTILTLILATLTLFSLYQSQVASATAEIARVNAREAQMQRNTAEAAGGLALQQQLTAEAAGRQEAQQRQRAETASALEYEQRKKYEASASTAEAASALARQQALEANLAEATAQAANRQSQSSRLSSLSGYFIDTQPDLSLLLAVESLRISSSLESRRALLNSIQRRLVNRAAREGFPWYVATRPYSVALSPDGTQVVVSTVGDIYLWDIASREPVKDMPPGFTADYSMFSVAFDSTGNLLARAGGDGKVLIWDRPAGALLKPFRPFGLKFTSLLSIAFQPGGSLLAVSTDIHPDTGKGQVYLYNYKENSITKTFNCGSYACVKVAWSPDGSRLAIAGQNGAIQVIDAVLLKPLLTISRAHNGEISGLAWYPDGSRLVSSGYDQRLTVWDINAQTTLRQTALLKKSAPNSLAISPDGRFLLAGVNNGEGWFGIWDAETLQSLDYETTGHTRQVAAVAFSPQGSRFVTAGYDNAVVLWKFEPVDSLGKLLVNLPGPRVEGAGQDATGRLLFARNTGEGTLDIFTEGSTEPATHNTPHTALAFAQLAGRPVVVVSGTDGRVSFIDPADWSTLPEVVAAISGRVRSLAVSSDGRLLAVASCKSTSSCGQLALRDLSAGGEIPLVGDLNSLKLDIITALAFSADAKTLAIGSSTGQISLYDISTGKTRQAVTEGLSLQKMTLAVTSLAFSPAEQGLLIAGFQDGRIALWDAATLGPVGEFVERLNGEVTGLLLRQRVSGPWALVSVSSQGEAREWDIDPTAWVVRACQMAGRNLTPEEKAKFLLPGSSPENACQVVK